MLKKKGKQRTPTQTLIMSTEGQSKNTLDAQVTGYSGLPSEYNFANNFLSQSIYDLAKKRILF